MIVLQKDDRDLVPRSSLPRIARADPVSGAHAGAGRRHGGREMRLGQGYCQTYGVSSRGVSITSSFPWRRSSVTGAHCPPQLGQRSHELYRTTF